jgi:hypothetical protein
MRPALPAPLCEARSPRCLQLERLTVCATRAADNSALRERLTTLRLGKQLKGKQLRSALRKTADGRRYESGWQLSLEGRLRVCATRAADSLRYESG